MLFGPELGAFSSADPGLPRAVHQPALQPGDAGGGVAGAPSSNSQCERERGGKGTVSTEYDKWCVQRTQQRAKCLV